MVSRQYLAGIQAPTPFVRECQRILQLRLAATTREDKDDCEWMWTYLLQMAREGRLEEYFSQARDLEAR